MLKIGIGSNAPALDASSLAYFQTRIPPRHSDFAAPGGNAQWHLRRIIEEKHSST